MTRCMVRGSLHINQEQAMKADLRMERGTAKGSLNIEMEISSEECSKMENETEKVFFT